MIMICSKGGDDHDEHAHGERNTNWSYLRESPLICGRKQIFHHLNSQQSIGVEHDGSKMIYMMEEGKYGQL